MDSSTGPGSGSPVHRLHGTTAEAGLSSRFTSGSEEGVRDPRRLVRAPGSVQGLISSEEVMNMRPPAFLLGGNKCGTTFLFGCLRQHPRIEPSRPKEPRFFMLDEEFHRGKKYYADHHYDEPGEERVLLDAQTLNLYLPWVPERIGSLFPEARLIILVRNPVDRCYSQYLHGRRRGVISESFSDALYTNYRRLREKGFLFETAEGRELIRRRYRPPEENVLIRTYLDNGHYERFIRSYRERFESNRIKIVFFEELVKDPLTVCNELFDFLGLAPLQELRSTGKNTASLPRSFGLQRLIKTLGRTSLSSWVPVSVKRFLVRLNLRSKSSGDQMEDLTRLWLYQHYVDSNRRLETLVDRVPPAWFPPGDRHASSDW